MKTPEEKQIDATKKRKLYDQLHEYKLLSEVAKRTGKSRTAIIRCLRDDQWQGNDIVLNTLEVLIEKQDEIQAQKAAELKLLRAMEQWESTKS